MNKQRKKSAKSTEPLKPQEELTLQPGQDLFQKSLEMALEREVPEEEADLLDRILSGLPLDEMDEEVPQDEAVDEVLSEEEVKAYAKIQDKIDEYLKEIGAVKSQSTENPEKDPSVTSEDTKRTAL
jgi:hypothetical protein